MPSAIPLGDAVVLTRGGMKLLAVLALGDDDAGHRAGDAKARDVNACGVPEFGVRSKNPDLQVEPRLFGIPHGASSSRQ
jgi:hypothetical protein